MILDSLIQLVYVLFLEQAFYDILFLSIFCRVIGEKNPFGYFKKLSFCKFLEHFISQFQSFNNPWRTLEHGSRLIVIILAGPQSIRFILQDVCVSFRAQIYTGCFLFF